MDLIASSPKKQTNPIYLDLKNLYMNVKSLPLVIFYHWGIYRQKNMPPTRRH